MLSPWPVEVEALFSAHPHTLPPPLLHLHTSPVAASVRPHSRTPAGCPASHPIHTKLLPSLAELCRARVERGLKLESLHTRIL